MPAEVDNPSSTMTASNSGSGEASVSSLSAAADPHPKRKRNLPGTPDPKAEVVALSPKTLLATNRFVCEICNKGFQRDQNLQLHRRGHNLPWKLRQRGTKEVRKKVYVCPEKSCVHHDPSRALGDLTGIKKHFCRKHGEKKWKCDKCSKKYAVQSDWKAHLKTCGTKEYRCHCGTLFSRRDSFITHQAFCDALAEESGREKTNVGVADSGTSDDDPRADVVSPKPLPEVAVPMASVVAAATTSTTTITTQEMENPTTMPVQHMPPPSLPPPVLTVNTATTNHVCSSSTTNVNVGVGGSLFTGLFASATNSHSQNPSFSDNAGAILSSSGFRSTTSPLEPISLCLSTNGPNLISAPIDRRSYPPPPPSPHMSATALLQKAAQMGAASSNPSLLRGFGFSTSTSAPSPIPSDFNENYQWRNQQTNLGLACETPVLSASLGLGLSFGSETGGGSALPELPPFCGSKPATLDFLGLGMSRVGSDSGGLSALITSIGGDGLQMGGGNSNSIWNKSSWDGIESKPSNPPLL